MSSFCAMSPPKTKACLRVLPRMPISKVLSDTMGDVLAAIVGCALEILVLLSGCRRDIANKSKQCS
jgi:hypothetical protein